MTERDIKTILLNYHHLQSAHCETGVTAGLLQYHRIPCTEALALGIGSGMFFAYLPFFRVGDLPLISYRMMPGYIFRSVMKRLKVQMQMKQFKNEKEAMNALDQILNQGIPVGCQTGIYWLPYFPPSMRFHFNAHNLIVYGREENHYLISDPVFESPVTCRYEELAQARFAYGPLAPKGRMYWITSVPQTIDWRSAIIQGIRNTCFLMGLPGGPVGSWGPYFLAWRMEKWVRKLPPKRIALLLSTIVRMQEEIGTGGAGFRFMYAAFLQESAELLGFPVLLELSREMTAIGDLWREFAVAAIKISRSEEQINQDTLHHLASILQLCAQKESKLFSQLQKVVKSIHSS